MSKKERKTEKVSDEARNKKNNHIKEELKRLEGSLQLECSKIKPPEIRDHIPYIFSSPYPYCSTDVVKFLIEMPDNGAHHGYRSRTTAIGLCDPEKDHLMDISSANNGIKLPPIKRGEPSSQKHTPRSNEQDESTEKRRPKEGSTYLPKFPAVVFDVKDIRDSKKPLDYNEVPTFRQKLRKKYIQNNKKKTEEEYTRTRNDIYRMELDRLENYHPQSRPIMRKVYFAYLQNNCGSKKATYECLRAGHK